MLVLFLSLIDEKELLLFYHKAMINIDLLQKSFWDAKKTWQRTIIVVSLPYIHSWEYSTKIFLQR